jgi:hypothetical protein
MSSITKQTTPTYSIEGLTSLELDLLKACLSVAPLVKIKNHLIGQGLDVPPNVVSDIQNKLWVEVVQ